MMLKKVELSFFAALITSCLFAQNYPQNYFRNPLDIPMKLVANFGEIRANHWHMGLDIRTQQKVNLPVYAAADGYISRVSIEPGGFGQAIYINHPNGMTTLYAHLNAFFPELAQYVKEQQYLQESWRINLTIPPNRFPVKKGAYIALSGSTGASEGPHVHFEIRDTKTENCLNPLLFHFPVPDEVPPTVYRVAMYDRNKSTYGQQPQFISKGSSIRVGTSRLSFAIGAADHFTRSSNPNGIYGARLLLDGVEQSSFVLNDISYDATRYINAQVDYRYKNRGGSYVQHISPLPGDRSGVYKKKNDGIIKLNDQQQHTVLIEVFDASQNTTKLSFTIKYDPALTTIYTQATDQMLPNNVNVWEKENFELFTTERTIYDTMAVAYSVQENNSANAISPLYTFMSQAYPAHDSVTVRLKPSREIQNQERAHVIIKNTSGNRTYVQRADWQRGWISAKFRQFGSYQAFIDNEPPTVNTVPLNLTRAGRIVFTPKDNFNAIRNFRAEIDGHWLRFSNDKGHSWIYYFDDKFPKGEHTLRVIVEDEAGNEMTRSWTVTR